MTRTHNASRQSIKRHLLLGLAAAGLLIGGVAGWGGTAELSGAVIASGVVVVDSEVQKVEHPTGGIVGELLVRNDQHVEAGDVVVRLDETQTKANLAVYTKSLDELRARHARLEAEKDGAETIQFPDDLLAREANDAQLARVLKGERKLFELRRDARNGQKAQLRERASQLRLVTEGLSEQIEAKEEEISLIESELEGVLDLWAKKLIAITRMNALKRDAARLGGERGQLIASRAETGGKIAEVELSVIQIDQDLRSAVAEELSSVRAKITELSERKIAAEDQLKHIDIRAPQTGRVHELVVHTVGEVITEGETIMLIVPDDEALGIRAKISPNDVDDLRPGQPARLRFSAFNMTTTPEINGTVSWIAADQTEDERTGETYYTIRVAASDGELARLAGSEVIPGMLVEVFIQTKSRTMLSYLTKPLVDQAMRMFRES